MLETTMLITLVLCNSYCCHVIVTWSDTWTIFWTMKSMCSVSLYLLASRVGSYIYQLNLVANWNRIWISYTCLWGLYALANKNLLMHSAWYLLHKYNPYQNFLSLHCISVCSKMHAGIIARDFSRNFLNREDWLKVCCRSHKCMKLRACFNCCRTCLGR